MVKRKSMNAMNIPAYPNSGKDFRRVLTRRLMLGMAFTERSGLITLRILNDFS